MKKIKVWLAFNKHGRPAISRYTGGRCRMLRCYTTKHSAYLATEFTKEYFLVPVAAMKSERKKSPRASGKGKEEGNG